MAVFGLRMALSGETKLLLSFSWQNGIGLREHTHKKGLKFGHCLEGGRGFQAWPNCMEHFFIIEGGNCLNFSPWVLQGCYRGIVCDFPAVNWIFIEQTWYWHLEHQYSSGGNVLLRCPNFIGGRGVGGSP